MSIACCPQRTWLPLCQTPSLQTPITRFVTLRLGAEALEGAQERPAWQATDLGAAMRLTQDALRKRALFWIGHGVLEETRTPTGVVSTPRRAVLADVTLACCVWHGTPVDGH